MARWVTIKPEAFPFDFRVRKTNSWLHFMADGPGDTGERYVPDDQADFIIARGYGVEGKAIGSTAKSRKGATAKRKTAKTSGNAAAANSERNDRVDDADLSATDRADVRNGVDQAAG